MILSIVTYACVLFCFSCGSLTLFVIDFICIVLFAKSVTFALYISLDCQTYKYIFYIFVLLQRPFLYYFSNGLFSSCAGLLFIHIYILLFKCC